jgi:hypothetical protein
MCEKNERRKGTKSAKNKGQGTKMGKERRKIVDKK